MNFAQRMMDIGQRYQIDLSKASMYLLALAFIAEEEYGSDLPWMMGRESEFDLPRYDDAVQQYAFRSPLPRMSMNDLKIMAWIQENTSGLWNTVYQSNARINEGTVTYSFSDMTDAAKFQLAFDSERRFSTNRM